MSKNYAIFQKINYSGTIIKPDKIIACEGEYFCKHFNERMGGIWRMDPVLS